MNGFKDPFILLNPLMSLCKLRRNGIKAVRVKNKNERKTKMANYKIQDREAGNVIETGLTLEEAEELLTRFEKEDKQDGTYTPNFYEIAEE